MVYISRLPHARLKINDALDSFFVNIYSTFFQLRISLPWTFDGSQITSRNQARVLIEIVVPRQDKTCKKLQIPFEMNFSGEFKRCQRIRWSRVTWVSSDRGTTRTSALPFPRTVRFAIWVVTTESWPSLRLRAWDCRPRQKGRPTAPWRTSVSLIAVRVVPVQHRIDWRPSSHRDTFYSFGTDETWLIEEDEGCAKR